VGIVLCGKGEEGLDVKKIVEELPPRWVVIHGSDQKAHKREALEALRKTVSPRLGAFIWGLKCHGRGSRCGNAEHQANES
jgi:hypothetical protein